MNEVNKIFTVRMAKCILKACAQCTRKMHMNVKELCFVCANKVHMLNIIATAIPPPQFTGLSILQLYGFLGKTLLPAYLHGSCLRQTDCLETYKESPP